MINNNNKNNEIQYTEDELLYLNNVGRKSYQWELWQYCNSLCKFCYLGEDNRIYNKARQITSLKDLDKAIDNLDFTKYNNISLIGGEFFQGQLDDKEVHDLFFKVLKKIFQLYLDKKIGAMWITCTMTIGNQKHLYELLDLAESMKVFPVEEYGSSGLWLCTSWDAAGRFHTPQMEENWKYHMKNIKKKYPWIKFNTTIILQQKFIDMYMNDEFVLQDFVNEYQTTLFFKQCGVKDYKLSELGLNITKEDCIRDPKLLDVISMTRKKKAQEFYGFDFLPRREDFIEFLIKFYKKDREYADRLFNIKYRSDELHRNFVYHDHDDTNFRFKNGVGAEEKGVGTLPCGHTETYACYIDSTACCICDKLVVAEQF